jgi:uncharacterized protein (DUF427 family)
VERSGQLIRVVFARKTIASSTASVRVLETSHPPTYYIPPGDVDLEALSPNSRSTICEYKGVARYYDIEVAGRTSEAAAWFYPRPARGYDELAGHVAFYAGKVDECWVDDELVIPQPGDFYGGWITSNVAGPFKGS